MVFFFLSWIQLYKLSQVELSIYVFLIFRNFFVLFGLRDDLE